MDEPRVTRILILTDVAEPSPGLLDAVRHRHERGPAQFRVVVPNPARAELVEAPSGSLGLGVWREEKGGPSTSSGRTE